MLYTDKSRYATYLLSLFELLWKQSVPAQQRIDELLEQRKERVNDMNNVKRPIVTLISDHI
ncbi:MAG: hypothetical protein ACXV46_04990 [Halobacteriota archaeon]